MTQARTDPRHARAAKGEVLIDVESVTKTFSNRDGEPPVLDHVSFSVHEGEIVALLGRSGSGKSTLLRCVAGLLQPTSGSVRHRGRTVEGPNPGTAMVFQSFALMPWLTVRQNVELGLEAKGIGRAERREKAERVIDIIGLDGFEDAYPKEISGGMRQRVGFARALVVEPEVLLMDEPFSALDVLTAENLRGELLELWGSEAFPVESIVIVTHNIEEAVLLADRIVILGSNPGRVRLEVPVDLPRPRDRHAPAFGRLVNRIYEVMTGRLPAEVVAPMLATPASVPLPRATVDGLSGFAELLSDAGPQPVAEIADRLSFEMGELLPVLDALELLGFAEVDAGTVALTDTGRTFASADIQASKRIFALAVLQHAPLVRLIAGAVAKEVDSTVKGRYFRDELNRSFSETEAQVQLEIASDWGRYAEQFSFDVDHDEFVADPDRDRVLVEGGE